MFQLYMSGSIVLAKAAVPESCRLPQSQLTASVRRNHTLVAHKEAVKRI